MFAHNELRLAGRVSGMDELADVRVEIDGLVLHAARGLPVASGDEATGFELRLDTRGWAPGPRQVRVVAEAAGARTTELTGDVDVRPFEEPRYTEDENREAIAAGRTAMWCEQPWLDGSADLVEPLRVEGWAWCNTGVDNVTVYIDGALAVRALHGLARTHLRGPYGEAVAGGAGFAATLDPAECPPGWHQVAVVATGADDRSVGLAGPVLVRGQADAVEPREPAGGDVEPALTATLVADRYVPEAHVGYSFEPEHHARYRWAAKLARDRTVLDAGCGTGFGSEILARSGATRVDGFDVSLEAVEHALRRAGELAEFVVGDLNRIPFPDDAFELVTCFEAIEHVADPFRVMDELRRVVAPGGLVLVSTPNRGVYAAGNPHHLHELTSEEFATALRERFPHVVVLLQQTHSTSLIADPETFALADSAVALDVDVRKVASVNPGEEVYSVAVASDAPVPELPNIAVLGGALDFAERQRESTAWQERALLSEAAAAAERVDAALALASQERSVRELASERARREEAQAALASERARREEAQAALAGQREATAAEGRARASVESDLRALERSPAWRLTSPLRRARRVLRRTRTGD